jgi:hypothetical protein
LFRCSIRARFDIDLLKNPPFILREAQDERKSGAIIGDFPFMLSLVEAFLGFSAESISDLA